MGVEVAASRKSEGEQVTTEVTVDSGSSACRETSLRTKCSAPAAHQGLINRRTGGDTNPTAGNASVNVACYADDNHPMTVSPKDVGRLMRPFQRNRGEASLLLCALDVSRAFFATRNQLLTAMHPVVRWFCAEMMLRTSTEQAPTRTSAPSNPRVVLTAKQLGRRGPVWVSESEPLLNSSHPNRVVGCQYHRHRAESFPRSW